MSRVCGQEEDGGAERERGEERKKGIGTGLCVRGGLSRVCGQGLDRVRWGRTCKFLNLEDLLVACSLYHTLLVACLPKRTLLIYLA